MSKRSADFLAGENSRPLELEVGVMKVKISYCDSTRGIDGMVELLGEKCIV